MVLLPQAFRPLPIIAFYAGGKSRFADRLNSDIWREKVMTGIYTTIQQNPALAVWFFAAMNGLWLVFVYFNSQRHGKTLEALRHSLNLDAERRKKVFEMKAGQYESYVTSLDAFGMKHQVDLPNRMQPVFNEYLHGYLAASEAGDKDHEQEVIARFSAQVSSFMREGMKDYLRLQAEANRLKLTASDSMLESFEELDAAMSRAIEKSNEFMASFTELVLKQDFEAMSARQRELEEHGSAVKSKARELMKRMRADLAEI